MNNYVEKSFDSAQDSALRALSEVEGSYHYALSEVETRFN